MTTDKGKKQGAQKTGGGFWIGMVLLFVLSLAAGAFLYVTYVQPPPAKPAVPERADSPPVLTPPDEETMVWEDDMPPPPAPVVQPEPPAPAVPEVLPPPSAPEDGMPALLLDNLAGTLTLASPRFEEGRRLPLNFTCYWENVSPPLRWTGAPEGTQSFVVFLERREAGQPPFLNWAAYNIPGADRGIRENVPKQATVDDGPLQAVNGYNNPGYAGPCEPKGTVPYLFRVFALDTVLNAPGGLDKAALINAMNGHIVDMAEMPVVHYFRM